MHARGPLPTAKIGSGFANWNVVSATYSSSDRVAVKLRSTRSLAARARLSLLVVLIKRRRLTPLNPASQIRRATRLRPIRIPASFRSAWMRGAPYVSYDAWLIRFHHLGQDSVFNRSRGWASLQPCIISAGGDFQYSAHYGNRIFGLVRTYQFMGGMVPVSRANQAAAFARMSRSCFSRRFSLRNSRTSSLSEDVSPSWRMPSSRSACLTQFRIDSNDGSNSRANAEKDRPERASSTI